MTKQAMSFKAQIKRIAAEEDIPAQVVLQNFMFERFFARLAKTTIRNKLIIKGGALISQYLGLSKRTTMDIDVTLRNAPLTRDSVSLLLRQIFAVEIDDGVLWQLLSIAPIRKDDQYGGFRVKLRAEYFGVKVLFSIDVSTGDAITPRPEDFIFMSRFEVNRSFRLKAYTVETVIAEKLEAILTLGIMTTRMRDFYDIFMLSKVVKVNQDILKRAIVATVKHRGSKSILSNPIKLVDSISASTVLRKRWENYQREFTYAREIYYDEICAFLSDLVKQVMI